MRKINDLLPRTRPGASATLGLILLACFLLVSFSIKSYGASYDETSDYGYADSNLQVYSNLIYDRPYAELIQYYDLRYKGPAYWLVGKILSANLAGVFPALDTFDAWHIVNFATFLLGAWCLYCLARRLVSPRAAFLAALLFLTQPLLWGHGVMNPKDTPFMTFFLAAVLAGVRMAEEIARPASPGRARGRLWQGRRRYWIGLALALAVLALVDRLLGHFITLPPVTAVVTQAYDPASTGFLHSLFLRIAAHSAGIPVSTYIDKVMLNVNLAEFLALALVAGGGLVLWLARTSTRNRWIFLAGVAAGMTVSIRILGPAAMGLVGLYALARLRRQALKPLLVYAGFSLVTAFVFWPFLWSAPIDHFLESLRVMANFPWPGAVRFGGTDYLAGDLPWDYLPRLILIQFTLPLLALAAAGLFVLTRAAIKRVADWKLALVPILWFFVPLAGVLVDRPSMYDNFRQFLFIMPPLFLFAAAALEAILDRLKTGLGRGVLAAAVLLPGLAAGIWLHPYEYVYYNALVGWTGNVGRQYETDYWLTSMCEAGRYVSAAAPAGAKVATTDAVGKIFLLRCMDKKLEITVERAAVSQISPDFSVIPTRYDDDKDYFRKMPVVDTIGRGKTAFSVVKKVP